MRLKATKILILSCAVQVCVFVSPMVAPGSPQQHQTQISPDHAAQVRRAMATTTLSSANITQAYDACEQWNVIMADANELPVNIRGICFALKASCEARIGQDTLALDSYQSCLNLKEHIPKNTFNDATMGKAFALQRLMKYDEAQLAFRECDTERACVGAVTCLLRLYDADGAEKMLRDFYQRHEESKEAEGLLGILLYMQSTTKNEVDEAKRLLERSCNKSPLYQWAHRVLSKQDGADPSCQNALFDFLELASVNQSPFDDPLLIRLDDKVLLHDILTNPLQETSSFWPEGFVVPRDSVKLKAYLAESRTDDTTEKKWILKQRAGYGSHGNELMRKQELLDRLEEHSEDYSEAMLCQKLVTPSLLLNGYKFTLRIYVIYFPRSEQRSEQVYLAGLGLVKLASLPFDQDEVNDDRIHMTNSGREAEMGQCDLKVLESEFEKAGWSYSRFWNDIRDSNRQVMQTYLTFAKEQRDHQTLAVGKLGIPKIMGFDYIVDANLRPFLLEVNRFPGLEPRDASDTSVKQAVVHGAWTLAADRMGLDMKESHRLVEFDVAPCSFERLI